MSNSPHKNINITLLTLFQLLIFVAPLTIKAGHHHESDSLSSSPLFPGKTVSKEEHCPICNFEFVNFINQPLSAYFFSHQACAIDSTVSVERVFRHLLMYVSLRAPPQF